MLKRSVYSFDYLEYNSTRSMTAQITGTVQHRCKPIVKWAGGKTQLLNVLRPLLPKKYNRYFEPFIGGGALFFSLKTYNAFINDYNPEVINLYTVVRDSPDELLQALSKHKNDEEYYYWIRALDRDLNTFTSLNTIEKASRFLYLNKTGYNGLCRVNSKGEHNVPFGGYKKITYYDPQNIKNCSMLLQNTEIENNDFDIIKPIIQKGDFVYFDPPYMPINATSSFTGYTDKGFDEQMQRKLKALCEHIHNIEAYFMLSNSNTDFIINLYKESHYTIHNTVTARRSINSNSNGRGKIKELIITNY